jgi:hypothetical protein
MHFVIELDFPLPSMPPSIPEQTPYVFGQTKEFSLRAHLDAYTAKIIDRMEFHNKSGRVIGSLHPHNKGQFELLDTSKSMPPRGEELIWSQYFDR